MEGPRVLAALALGVAAIVLVPTFNALNEQRLGDVRPPMDFDQPPPDIDPPPDIEPPPLDGTPPCEPGSRRLYDRSFTGSAGGDETFTLPTGTAQVVAAGQYQEYRGESSLRFTTPSGATVVRASTTTAGTLVAASNQQIGPANATAEEGDWLVAVTLNGLTGGFRFAVEALGCFPPGGR